MTIDPEAFDRLLSDAAQAAEACVAPGLREAVAGLRRPGADARLRVVFLGEFGNGKSQVVNALLGDAYLPASASPTTCLLTEVTYGAHADATLVREDGIEERAGLERLAEVPRDAGYQRARVTLPVDWLRDFVLVDTPGLSEPEETRAEIVYDELPRADVVVFVLHAQAPVRRSERLFLADRLLKHDRSKLVFLLNQVDRLHAEARAEAETYARRQLEALLGRAPLLLPYSALEALRGQLEDEPALLAQSNHPEVERQLVQELVSDRRRLRQANALAWLRDSLDEARGDLRARREASQLTLAELDERLARLEREETHYRARVDRICERASGRLELITSHLDSQLQALRLRVDTELPRLLEGVEPREIRKHLPFYLESLVKGFLEWAEPSVQSELTALYAEVDRDLSEAAAAAVRAIDLRPGYLAAALRTRPAKFDPATQASRLLGVSGIGLLVMGELPLAGILLVVSQTLRFLARGRRQEAERAQMVEAGQRAMRACLDRAHDELARQMSEYQTGAVAAIRADGAARMQHVVDALAQARDERRASESQREDLPGDECDAALERINQRVRKFEEAVAGAH